MNFSNDKAIYVQIAERLCDEILAGKYKEDERIPSVREYAVLLEVNANTTVYAFPVVLAFTSSSTAYSLTLGIRSSSLYLPAKISSLNRSAICTYIALSLLKFIIFKF